MLTQVHELSELLFKVKSGKVDHEAALYGADSQVIDCWEDQYFDSTGIGAGAAGE